MSLSQPDNPGPVKMNKPIAGEVAYAEVYPDTPSPKTPYIAPPAESQTPRIGRRGFFGLTILGTVGAFLGLKQMSSSLQSEDPVQSAAEETNPSAPDPSRNIRVDPAWNYGEGLDGALPVTPNTNPTYKKK